MSGFLRAVAQPEYVHTLVNPLPVYGLAVAWFALVISVIVRSRALQVTALALVLVCAASAWPVVEFGKEAKDRVIAMENESGAQWIEEHEHRADELVLVFYLLAIVAAAGVFVPMKWPRAGWPLAIAAAILGAAALSCGAYIAYAGGKIRHHEFRLEPPPIRTPTP
jgi:hypothetical protein